MILFMIYRVYNKPYHLDHIIFEHLVLLNEKIFYERMKLYNDIRKLEHSLKAVKSREDQLGLKALLYTLDIYQVKPMTQNETNLYFCQQHLKLSPKSLSPL